MSHINWLSLSQIQHFIQENEYAIDYRNETHPKTFYLKYPDDHQYLDMYKNKKLKQKYNDKIEEALQRSRALPIHVEYWKLIVTENVEANMPYTLGDVIFFPKVYLDKSSISDLQYTLFHELIHILQRKYPKQFDVVSNQILGFRKMKVNFDVSIVDRPVFYSNPDGKLLLEDAWVFQNFMPVMLLHENQKTYQKGYFEIIDTHDPSFGKIVKVTRKCPSSIYGDSFPECSPSHMYHPYEILADTGAKYIIFGKTKNQTLDLWWKHFFSRKI